MFFIFSNLDKNMPLLIFVTAKTQKISTAKSLKVTVWKVTKSFCQEQNLIILHEIFEYV